MDDKAWIALALAGLAWLVRIVQSESQGRENAKRNAEINDKLDEIVIQTNKTNGRVGRHDEILETHGREIERLRDTGERNREGAARERH